VLAAPTVRLEDPSGLPPQRGPAGVVDQRVAPMTHVVLVHQPAQRGAVRDLEQRGQPAEPELGEGRPAGHHLGAAVTLVVGAENGAYVVLADPAAAQMLGERLLGLEGLRSQYLGRTDDGVLEREVLEGVQRVVVHEETQRRLLGKKVRDVIQNRGDERLRTGPRLARRVGRKRNRLTRRRRR
jgi:hypothetical protein